MNFNPNKMFYYYLYWIVERMNIFWKRVDGQTENLTDDPIFTHFKFTNVYRSLDRVSQYLISDVIYDGKSYSREDLFFRILLFKHFNKIETWKALELEFGVINFDLFLNNKDLIRFVENISDSKLSVYNNAYMLTAYFFRKEKFTLDYNDGKPFTSKFDSYMSIFFKDLHLRGGMYKILDSGSLEDLFHNFSSINTVGKFLAMQYSIDMNYSNLFNFDENEYIVAGAGAERGIQRTFDINGKPDYIEIIKWVEKNFEQLFEDYNLSGKFESLPNRKPKLIDIQNCFCEVDKYLRGMGHELEGVSGKRIKNFFKPTSQKLELFFPPKWNVKL